MQVRVLLSIAVLAAITAGPAGPLAQTLAPSLPVALPVDGPAPLSQEISALLRDPAVSQAHWGIAVTTLQGDPIFTLDENKLFRPASTAKLFTTAAALALLGADHHFETRVYGNLDPATGIVQGDLTLVGGGDPAFGTSDLPYRHEASQEPQGEALPRDSALQMFVTDLTKGGVKQITGAIVGDDSLFEDPRPPEGWAAEDLPWGYGALPNALPIGDNALRVEIEPEEAKASVSIDQLFPYLQVDLEVRTVPKAETATMGVDVEQISATPPEVRLFGAVSKGAATVQHLAMPQPAVYAAGALRSLLLNSGVAVAGQAEPRHALAAQTSVPFLSALRAPGCEASLWGAGPACTLPCPQMPLPGHLLGEHLSPPLQEDVVFTLKTSANLHAEVLLHQLGLLVSCQGVTTLQGARVLRAWLQHAGIRSDEVLLYDGSGLSTKDLVTPRSETQLLVYASAQPWFSAWFRALPVGGVDGTLASRFTEAPLQKRVMAKTGTLGETRALAGYVQCASGKMVAFSILVDNHEPGSSADRTTMDRIVAAIARQN